MCPRASSRKKIPVVITLPSSTMNITGFLSCSARIELRERVADRGRRTSSREKMLRADLRGPSSVALSPAVECEVELEDVDARLAEEAPRAAGRVLRDQLLHRRERQVADGRDPARLQLRRRPARCPGRCPTPRSSPRRPGCRGSSGPGCTGPRASGSPSPPPATFFARSGFVGPRLAKVVPPAL